MNDSLKEVGTLLKGFSLNEGTSLDEDASLYEVVSENKLECIDY